MFSFRTSVSSVRTLSPTGVSVRFAGGEAPGAQISFHSGARHAPALAAACRLMASAMLGPDTPMARTERRIDSRTRAGSGRSCR